jgi:hypothetical protein
MRLPPVGFKVRQMMIAIALVAVCLAILLMCQRLAGYRRMYSAYDHDSRFIRKTIWLNEERIRVLRSRGVRDQRAAAEAVAIMEDLRTIRQSAEQLEHLRQKYESAVWRPWSLLEPDPPPPEP